MCTHLQRLLQLPAWGLRALRVWLALTGHLPAESCTLNRVIRTSLFQNVLICWTHISNPLHTWSTDEQPVETLYLVPQIVTYHIYIYICQYLLFSVPFCPVVIKKMRPGLNSIDAHHSGARQALAYSAYSGLLLKWLSHDTFWCVHRHMDHYQLSAALQQLRSPALPQNRTTPGRRKGKASASAAGSATMAS